MTLRCENLRYDGGGRALLDDVSLSVQPGEMVAVIGRNGAGKSTLLRVASGLATPTRGQVLLDGRPLTSWGRQALSARRAMLMQESPVRAGFTVAEVVAFGARALPLAARGRLVGKQLAHVGLADMAGRDIATLSGGERQRAHFARVLVQLEAGAHGGTPGLLLLDEPLSAQDFACQGLMLDCARDYVRRGGSCLMVVHDLNWASCRADRIVVMTQGRIHADGPPASVLTPQIMVTAFDARVSGVHSHDETCRPFVVPHDLASTRVSMERNVCISQ